MITKGIRHEAKFSINQTVKFFKADESPEVTGTEYDYIFIRTMDFDFFDNLFFWASIPSDATGNTNKILLDTPTTTIHEATGIANNADEKYLIDVSSITGPTEFRVNICPGELGKTCRLEWWGFYTIERDIT